MEQHVLSRWEERSEGVARGGGLGPGSTEMSSWGFAHSTEGCLGEPEWLQRRSPPQLGSERQAVFALNKPGFGQGTSWNTWTQPIIPSAHAGSLLPTTCCFVDSVPALPRSCPLTPGL